MCLKNMKIAALSVKKDDPAGKFEIGKRRRYNTA